MTLLARQGLKGLFGQADPKLAALQPVILDSILIVHCSQRVRMENISEAGFWLEDETFEQDGQTVVRKKGQPVHQALMKSWRQLRK